MIHKTLHHYLIPHKGNNFKPKLFEYTALGVIFVIATFIFTSSITVNRFVHGTVLGANVYSSVLVDLTNDVRKENSLPLLALNTKLTSAAKLKATDMADNSYFAHTSPSGITPWYWFSAVDYQFAYAGENLAIDFFDSQSVENAWLASPKHRENILDDRFEEIGIATKTAQFQGRETTFVVQMFGTPTFADEPENIENTNVATKNIQNTISNKTNQEVVAPEVKGESTSNLAIIAENQNTIVVENTKATTASISPKTPEKYATPLDNAIVASPTYAHYMLLGLAIFLFLALMLFIFIEIKKQHPWHVLLGFALLVVVLVLAYISKSYYLVAF